jgi:Leucine-rich repeat (LRR) protein
LEEKTILCKADGYWNGARWEVTCEFENVEFNQDTKLKINRSGLPEATDEDFNQIRFSESSVSLVHPDILAKFPNIEMLDLGRYYGKPNVINNQEYFVNCQEITYLILESENLTGISSDTLSGCENLESLWIKTKSLTDLPDDFFKNQENLRDLTLAIDDLILRNNPFEGLTSLSGLSFELTDLVEIEVDFFQSLNIQNLRYEGNFEREYTFPIESLNSQETIEELTISYNDMSQIPEFFVPILRSMKKLRKINFCYSLIGSVEVFVDLPNVEEIKLESNEIEELPANAFKGCPRLTNLELTNNPIKVLRGDEFVQLTGLKSLDILYAKLASIAPITFHPLRSLEWLGLGDSFVGTNNTISEEVFIHSTNLKQIFLSGNDIQAIHPEAFSNLHNLFRLDLNGNKCVDESFWAPENIGLDMNLVKEKLKNCSENFLHQDQEHL